MRGLDPSADGGPRNGLGGLHIYLKGSWSILRLIEDRRLGLEGTLLGKASFGEHDQGLHYREAGRMRLGAYSGRANQTYLYRFPGDGLIEVHFADGRFFHALDLTGGVAEAEHLCARDRYRTRVELLTRSRWKSRWRVRGPAKDLLLTTWYLRFAEPPTCRHASGAADYLPGSR